MKYLIVGLGNPGEKYERTRHNLGFAAVDRLAKLAGGRRFRENRRIVCLEARLPTENGEVILIKPLTFMNRSGEAVSRMSGRLSVGGRQIVICADDSNLPVGKIRVRFSGEAGGHKGLQSVIEAIGADFWRVRVGIGRPEKEPLEDYVLRPVPTSQKAAIADAVDKAASFLLKSLPVGLENKTIK